MCVGWRNKHIYQVRYEYSDHGEYGDLSEMVKAAIEGTLGDLDEE
jgi:hypothetical protein